MRHSRTLRLSAILAVSAAAAVTLAGAAAAGRLFGDTFHEEDTVVVEDFCGAPV